MINNQVYPNLLLLGAPKCGTSSLHSWLCQHPSVTGSVPKETYFFLDEKFSDFNKLGKSHSLRDNFSDFVDVKGNKENSILLESTTQNIYCESFMALINEFEYKPRCIVIVRDPVERILSTFEYFSNTNKSQSEYKCFSDYVSDLLVGNVFTGRDVVDKALEWSDYRYYLERWESVVGIENLYVLDFNLLKDDPIQAIDRIETWLNIPSFLVNEGIFAQRNKTVVIKNSKLHRIIKPFANIMPSSNFKDRLRKFYRYFNSKNPTREMGDYDEDFSKIYDRLSVNYSWLAKYDIDVNKWWSKNG